MAVTTDNLITALRLGDTTEEREIAERLRLAAQELVEKTAPNAPDVLKDEAIIRLVRILVRPAERGARDGVRQCAFRNSGAKSILLPYRKSRCS